MKKLRTRKRLEEAQSRCIIPHPPVNQCRSCVGNRNCRRELDYISGSQESSDLEMTNSGGFLEEVETEKAWTDKPKKSGGGNPKQNADICFPVFFVESPFSGSRNVFCGPLVRGKGGNGLSSLSILNIPALFFNTHAHTHSDIFRISVQTGDGRIGVPFYWGPK